jgi:hypothetical protein
MATEIFETKVTASMTLADARALHKLLGKLPNKRNDATIHSSEFTPAQWERLMHLWTALEAHLGPMSEA